MTIARESHTATLLPNGQVLIAGGNTAFSFSGVTASAELFDPKTGLFTATGSMTLAREDHTATLLPNGRVLIAGGDNNSSGALGSAELYDFKTGTFAATGSMTTGRQFPTATLLSNGQVLVAGGFGLSSAELYDPKAGTFAATGPMSVPRFGHTAILLSSGAVLIAGGFNKSVRAELYDPAKGTFTASGLMTTIRANHTATLLAGRVLLVGGQGNFNPFIVGPLSSTELLQSGTFAAAADLNQARMGHTATLLAGGRVLVAGGSGGLGNVLASAELLGPSGKTCVSGSAGCWRDGDVITLDQRGWHGELNLVSSGLDFLYASMFGVLALGLPSPGFSMGFDTGDAVIRYLPANGTPAPLDANLSDPTTTASGVFGGDVVALQLNVDFADAMLIKGSSGIVYGDLTICSLTSLTPLNGMKVRDVLSIANTLLGGGSASFSIADFDPVLQQLNQSFGFGYTSDFARAHLVNGACP
jgi:hypothetical protein